MFNKKGESTQIQVSIKLPFDVIRICQVKKISSNKLAIYLFTFRIKKSGTVECENRTLSDIKCTIVFRTGSNKIHEKRWKAHFFFSPAL